MEETLTLIEKTAFMKGLPLLSSIPTEALAELAGRAREIHLDSGDVLFREGDANRGVYLVVEGRLEERKGRALVRVVEPGEGIGELWLGEGEPHAYTAVANAHTHVLSLERVDMVDTMLDYPEFATELVRALSLRTHELTGRILELEALVARLHASLRSAGVEPPDPRIAGDASEGDTPPGAGRGGTHDADAPPRT